MHLRHGTPTGREIKRRTFEGKTDLTANEHSLTSRYMPSLRYHMTITFEDGTTRENCFRTKRDAEYYYERCVCLAGKLL